MRKGTYLVIGFFVNSPDKKSSPWAEKLIREVEMAIRDADWGSTPEIMSAVHGMNIRTKEGVVGMTVYIPRPTNVETIDTAALISMMEDLVKTVVSLSAFETIEIKIHQIKRISKYEALRNN